MDGPDQEINQKGFRLYEFQERRRTNGYFYEIPGGKEKSADT